MGYPLLAMVANPSFSSEEKFLSQSLEILKSSLTEKYCHITCLGYNDIREQVDINC
jgi:hypothetical protein